MHAHGSIGAKFAGRRGSKFCDDVGAHWLIRAADITGTRFVRAALAPRDAAGVAQQRGMRNPADTVCCDGSPTRRRRTSTARLEYAGRVDGRWRRRRRDWDSYSLTPTRATTAW